MKTTLRNLALTLALTAVVVSAQTARSNAKIPFDFKIMRTTLPAGAYSVQLEPQTSTLTFRNLATGHSAVVPVHALTSGTKEQPKLTFHHDGERYTLDSAWFAGVDGGYSPLRGKTSRGDRERSMAATVVLLQK